MRKQFGPPGKDEIPVLEYQMQVCEVVQGNKNCMENKGIFVKQVNVYLGFQAPWKKTKQKIAFNCQLYVWFFSAMETFSQACGNICPSLFRKDFLYEFCGTTSWYDDG